MVDRKHLFVIVCLVGAVGAVAVVALPMWDEPAPSYTVEVVPTDTEAPAETVSYSSLTTTEQQQFKRSLSTSRSYESRPALADYASDQISYEGEAYTVLVSVAN